MSEGPSETSSEEASLANSFVMSAVAAVLMPPTPDLDPPPAEAAPAENSLSPAQPATALDKSTAAPEHTAPAPPLPIASQNSQEPQAPTPGSASDGAVGSSFVMSVVAAVLAEPLSAPAPAPASSSTTSGALGGAQSSTTAPPTPLVQLTPLAEPWPEQASMLPARAARDVSQLLPYNLGTQAAVVGQGLTSVIQQCQTLVASGSAELESVIKAQSAELETVVKAQTAGLETVFKAQASELENVMSVIKAQTAELESAIKSSTVELESVLKTQTAELETAIKTQSANIESIIKEPSAGLEVIVKAAESVGLGALVKGDTQGGAGGLKIGHLKWDPAIMAFSYSSSPVTSPSDQDTATTGGGSNASGSGTNSGSSAGGEFGASGLRGSSPDLAISATAFGGPGGVSGGGSGGSGGGDDGKGWGDWSSPNGPQQPWKLTFEQWLGAAAAAVLVVFNDQPNLATALHQAKASAQVMAQHAAQQLQASISAPATKATAAAAAAAAAALGNLSLRSRHVQAGATSRSPGMYSAVALSGHLGPASGAGAEEQVGLVASPRYDANLPSRRVLPSGSGSDDQGGPPRRGGGLQPSRLAVASSSSSAAAAIFAPLELSSYDLALGASSDDDQDEEVRRVRSQRAQARQLGGARRPVSVHRSTNGKVVVSAYGAAAAATAVRQWGSLGLLSMFMASSFARVHEVNARLVQQLAAAESAARAAEERHARELAAANQCAEHARQWALSVEADRDQLKSYMQELEAEVAKARSDMAGLQEAYETQHCDMDGLVGIVMRSQSDKALLSARVDELQNKLVGSWSDIEEVMADNYDLHQKVAGAEAREKELAEKLAAAEDRAEAQAQLVELLEQQLTDQQDEVEEYIESLEQRVEQLEQQLLEIVEQSHGRDQQLETAVQQVSGGKGFWFSLRCQMIFSVRYNTEHHS